MVEVNLSKYSTIGVGGRARVNIARTTEQLEGAGGVIIGMGSNLLFSGKGLPEITVNRTQGILNDGALIYAKSGQSMASVVSRAYSTGLSGLEWAYGLPGSVGGAVVGNAGALGNSVSDVVLYVDVALLGKRRRLSRAECGFSYRSSELAGLVVTGVCFMLARADKEEIRGRLAIAKSRRCAQPRGKSAGCIFKNPKSTSAGELIDKCRLKGKRVGGAVISTTHANFIINDKNATFSDVMTLIELAENSVYDSFGVRLEREIRIIGEI